MADSKSTSTIHPGGHRLTQNNIKSTAGLTCPSLVRGSLPPNLPPAIEPESDNICDVVKTSHIAEADGRGTQRRPQTESIHVTVSPDRLRTLRQTGNSGGDTEGGNDDEDPGMLHVVHLGMV
ncbi:hypothetical protein CHARACLAT_006149 [Characodon lateralis]|uniref:Uncharacterized protein n=1 Tax=Characodon lateralis TaxID=208331 RepID=A0ABU7DPD8_9TELE|nr:hypothetical protein [Characodon lateralis]